MSTTTVMVSRIKTAWLRRLVIVGTFPLLVLASLVCNAAIIAYVLGAFVVGVAWSIINLNITGVPNLIRTARKSW